MLRRPVESARFTGHEWQTSLHGHTLASSMNWRGNCPDNAAAESFFQFLKRERIRRPVYATRDDARPDGFSQIEMFYNSKRRHGTAGQHFTGRVRTTPFPTVHGCIGRPGGSVQRFGRGVTAAKWTGKMMLSRCCCIVAVQPMR